jgi:RNA polymerase sigma factor for flagellar operon FliA
LASNQNNLEAPLMQSASDSQAALDAISEQTTQSIASEGIEPSNSFSMSVSVLEPTDVSPTDNSERGLPDAEGSVLGSDPPRACAEEFVQSHPHPLKGKALKAYSHHTRQAREDKLILEYLPLVHRVVGQVVSYLQPPMTREDLISAGTIGLVKAARDYDAAHQTEFKTYAYIRVRGAILDELRSWSFAPSNLKKQYDQAQQVLQEMTGQEGEMPSDNDLADRLQMPVEKMYKMFENARTRHFLSIHGLSDDVPALGESLAAESEDPDENLERQELIEKLTRAIQDLPTKQRRIIILYYTRELTMKQIASMMDITESRISQLHAAALTKLAARLKSWKDSHE